MKLCVGLITSYQELVQKYESMDSRNPEMEHQLHNMLNDMERDLPIFTRDLGIHGNPIIEERTRLNKIINSRCSQKFKQCAITITKGQGVGIPVNGQQFIAPFNVTGYPLSDQDLNDYPDLWNRECQSTELSLAEFIDQADDVLCNEWSKMDEYGNSFSDPYWTAEEGTLERTNAYTWTRLRNMYLLYMLPYPKKYVLQVCEDLCYKRMESVQNVYFLMYLKHLQAQLYHGADKLQSYHQPETPDLNRLLV